MEDSPKPPEKRISISKNFLLKSKVGILLFIGEVKRQAYINFLDEKLDYKIKIEEAVIGCQIGGFTDLVAEKEKEQIAIEIETGKSNYLKNVEKNLEYGFKKIYVIATNDKAYRKIRDSIKDKEYVSVFHVKQIL